MYTSSLIQDRRHFLQRCGGILAGSWFAPGLLRAAGESGMEPIRGFGPASGTVPRVRVAFVRRRGEYGMRWPGQIYDGKAALTMYREKILRAGVHLNLDIQMRETPIYSAGEADHWTAQCSSESCDGLLVVLLDRQEHAWPTAARAADTGLPTVIFSPLGSSFTTNTHTFARRTGTLVCSTDDFDQVVSGLNMIRAGTRLARTRFLVLMGEESYDSRIETVGVQLRYRPASDFIELYNRIPVDSRVERLADELMAAAEEIHGPTKTDVCNGIKSLLVARELLQREACDGITMDCLGALGPTDISLPCIAWSAMNDRGVPAACEADLGACVTQAIVQYLFNAPGFQQDPVAETSVAGLIGSHCSCPTRLRGFDHPPEPYTLVPHHGCRDATARPRWTVGERITVADVVLGESVYGTVRRYPAEEGPAAKVSMIISSGEVLDNKSVPPSGGCVVAPLVKLDDVGRILDYPGFHQLIFYGDHKEELRRFCQLYRIEARVV